MKTIKFNFLVLSGLFLFLLNSCQNNKIEEELNKFQNIETLETENIEVVKKFYSFLDDVNLESLEGLLAIEHEVYFQSMHEPFILEDMKPLIEMYYTSFPDYKHEIENIFAADDKVVVQIKYMGTHSNKFMELDPTGNKFEYKGIAVFQLFENKISKFWVVEDELTMMTQLGLELK